MMSSKFYIWETVIHEALKITDLDHSLPFGLEKSVIQGLANGNRKHHSCAAGDVFPNGVMYSCEEP